MKKYRLFILFVPAISSVLVLTVLIVSIFLKKEIINEIRALFETHKNSVADIVKEGTAEAVTSTSLIYEGAYRDLVFTAEIFDSRKSDNVVSNVKNDLLEPPLVDVLISSNLHGEGKWGVVPLNRQKEFAEFMLEQNSDELIDEGILFQLNLLCIVQDIAESKRVVCESSDKIDKWKKDVGIGSLLNGITNNGVVYVALQDNNGIIAAAPPQWKFSDFEDDKFLPEALSLKNGDSRIYKNVINGGRYIFEGVIPFKLADDSTVALRIGIDAKRIITIKNGLSKRFNGMVLFSAILLLLIIALSVFAWIWINKREKSARLLQEQTEKQKHWELIGNMAATVAHEVRNPLSTLQMIAFRFKNEYSVNEKKEEFEDMTQMLIEESQRVNDVITDFLKVGKALVLNKEPVSISDLVKHSVELFKLKNSHIIFKTTINCNRNITLDPVRFTQIIDNLLSNAVDSIEESGTVDIEAKCDDKNLEILIKDTGCGISKDNQEEIFKTFVSFKKTGTGLGLPLVKKLLEAHGGSIDFQSEPGAGTTITINFPV